MTRSTTCPCDESDVSTLGPLRAVRMMRLLRLVKLLRILRASRIVARWQNFIGLSYAQMSMLKFATMTCFLVHILACFWSYQGINWRPGDDDLEHERVEEDLHALRARGAGETP